MNEDHINFIIMSMTQIMGSQRKKINNSTIPLVKFYQTQHKNSTSFNTNQTYIHIVHILKATCYTRLPKLIFT